MTFMESAIAMNTDYVECHNTLGKISLFAEASYKEYEINLKEIALKVLKENGTEEDYNFLATEAAKDYTERARKSIRKIIDAIVKFIRNCKDKIVSFFTGKKATEAVDKLEQACEKNSKIGSKKVKYNNTDKQVNALQQGIDRIKKKVAKVEAKGKATEDDLTSLEDISRETAKKVAAVAVPATITIAAAIALFRQFKNKSDVDSSMDGDFDHISEPKQDSVQDPVTANFLVQAANTIGGFVKEKAQLIVNKPMSLFKEVKGLVKSKNLETDEVATESVEFEDLPMFNYVTEKYDDVEETTDENTETVTENTETAGVVEGLDLDAYFTELCDELFTEHEETDTTGVDTDVETDEVDTTPEVAEEVTENIEETETTESAEGETETETESESESTDEETTETESAEIEDTQDNAVLYLEQLEHELFGESEDIVNEETEDVKSEESHEQEPEQPEEVESTEVTPEETEVTESTADVDDVFKSLLDEMESLLDD